MSYLDHLIKEARQAHDNLAEERTRMANIFIFGHENPTRRERFRFRLTCLIRRIRWWFITPRY